MEEYKFDSKGVDLGWGPYPCSDPDLPEAQLLAKFASVFEDEGIDHVLWGYSAHVLHGNTNDHDEVDYHFILPDDSIHRALKALLVTARAKLESLNMQPCRGQKDCPVFERKERPLNIWNIKLPEFEPRPAQHLHFTIDCDDRLGPGWISLHKKSALLPWIDSLKARPPPPEGSPGSAWGVVSADVYQHNFFGMNFDCDLVVPSLYPLRILPPHLYAQAYLYLMCRSEPGSWEERTWHDKFEDTAIGYYTPDCPEDKRLVRVAVLDPKLLAFPYQRYYNRIFGANEPLSQDDRINELRMAEGCPLRDPKIALRLAPPELGQDDDRAALTARAIEEEERRGGDSGAGGEDLGAMEEFRDALKTVFENLTIVKREEGGPKK